MTEKELRQKVADTISSWLGATRGSATHLEILRIYNNHRPLARGYTVQVGDAYCATTASAAYIATGISEYTGTECGCGKWVEIAKAKGIWVEDDAYVPGVGDACLYDWDDSGAGDNRGDPDHIGIVVFSNGKTFDVVEGNGSGGKVVKRTMSVNGRYIRGFICPDFALICAEKYGTPIKDDDDDTATIKKICVEISAEQLNGALGAFIKDFREIPWESVRDEIGTLVALGVIDGGTSASVDPNDVNMRLQLLRVLAVCKRYIDLMISQLIQDDDQTSSSAGMQ